MRTLTAPLLLWILAAGVEAQQQPRAPLVGSVLDPDGKPVADAVVEAWRTENHGTSCLDLAAMRDVVEAGKEPEPVRFEIER